MAFHKYALNGAELKVCERNRMDAEIFFGTNDLYEILGLKPSADTKDG